LDQTIVDSSSLAQYRETGNWAFVQENIDKIKVYTGIKDYIEKLRNNPRVNIAIVKSSPS
jgi:hypothetical protein